ncbi:putative glycosyl transferase-like protein [Trypanosoma cruzi]|uniref:Glycosyl transferase-like protein, putative n=2 Tax=Trypanosoma cruzi TaxID=5693 RepID=Q4CQM2_TRYCC|nr:glycosyl transferase-like protein, putative [Trypanosoma cruzi]EAN82572.1 glycosyl transferase-like protein, putative [Trypanosoma cruzi]PWV08814.1 putative glycosyl transferase-like protein [Trypanosoma cruzi]|eukprot:XP_804423.1 glycosyl transferase-like protein [Trypanosoma cruzi strain CL Brener]
MRLRGWGHTALQTSLNGSRCWGSRGASSASQCMALRSASSSFSFSMSTARSPFDAVYVINLNRRPDRWKFILRQLQRAGFREGEYERFTAVDGRAVDIQKAQACGLVSLLGILRLREEESRRIWGMDLNPAAVGCALSHVLLWATIAARRYHRVLVVEDDSLFPHDFKKNYDERMRHVPQDWELVYVSGLDTANQASQLRVAEGVSRVPQMHRTTNCYVVTHQGARRLLELCLPMTYQLDTMMTMHAVSDPQSGVPHVTSPVCYTLQPPLVVQATRMGSDIQSSNGRDEQEEERARCRAAGWTTD